jgi:Group II intron, maturase-specific domain
MSGPLWERTRQRVYFLQRWPSLRAMRRIRTRVRDLTPRARCHEDLRTVIADLNRVLRGWGQYFRTGNAATKFHHLDRYVEERLRGLRVKRPGSRLAAGLAEQWRRPFFEAFGLGRLRGTIQYPAWRMPRLEDHLVSRVREISTHGLNVVLTAPRSRGAPSRIYQWLFTGRFTAAAWLAPVRGKPWTGHG